MLKKISLITFFCLFNYKAFAETYGTIDTKRVLEEAQAVVHVQKIVNQKQLEYQDIITKEQEKLEKKKDSILAKKDILSAEAFKKEEQSLQLLVEEFKNLVVEKQNILKKSSLDAMKVVNEEIEKSITEVSQANGLAIVFPESQIVYYEESLDITDKVLASVNAKITKVDVVFDE